MEAMSALAWTEELRLDQPQMDQTHQEFVDLLRVVRIALETGEAQEGLATFEQLLAHTVDHFAREERWMSAIGLPANNAHAQQHAAVLKAMREALRVAREEGRWRMLRVAIAELSQWFPMHARMMDADLVVCMRKTEFDPATGIARRPLNAAALAQDSAELR
jgi:hemerythrin-like metal-binding protein